jgi:hypothetical protein
LPEGHDNGGAQISDGSGDTAYACTGATGPQGPPGPAGPTGIANSGYVEFAAGSITASGNPECYLILNSGPATVTLTPLSNGCEVSGFPIDSIPAVSGYGGPFTMYLDGDGFFDVETSSDYAQFTYIVAGGVSSGPAIKGHLRKPSS